MIVASLTDEVKQTARKWIDDHLEQLVQWHTHIWELAEPAWREYKSQRWYVETLRGEGFDVEDGSAGMPTAFCAIWSNGDGPTLLTYAEYDAVRAIIKRPPRRKSPGRGSADSPRDTPIHIRLSAFRLSPGSWPPSTPWNNMASPAR